jgi:hypothetical protein
MKYIEMKLGEDNKFYKAKETNIDNAMLSSECWSVQFRGFKACKGCDFKGKRDCGGKNIIKTGKNANGCKVSQNKGIA